MEGPFWASFWAQAMGALGRCRQLAIRGQMDEDLLDLRFPTSR